MGSTTCRKTFTFYFPISVIIVLCFTTGPVLPVSIFFFQKVGITVEDTTSWLCDNGATKNTVTIGRMCAICTRHVIKRKLCSFGPNTVYSMLGCVPNRHLCRCLPSQSGNLLARLMKSQAHHTGGRTRLLFYFVLDR